MLLKQINYEILKFNILLSVKNKVLKIEENVLNIAVTHNHPLEQQHIITNCSGVMEALQSF